MKKQTFLIYPLLLMGVFLVFASSCEKDEDDDEQQNILVLSTTEVTEITQTTATSGGNITDDGGTTVTARGVCWSTDQTPTINDSKTEDGNGAGSFTSSITGLEANTTYFVRAYATNSNGTGYGSAMSFTTQEGSSGGTFTDSRDGNVYQTVTIGNQTWMAENLKYLPSVVGPGTGSNTTAYYYVFGYDGTNVTDAKATANYETYGVLYNWSAAIAGSSSSTANPSGVQGVCPTGWHLPSDAEWKELEMALGMSQAEADDIDWRGTNEGSKLAGNASLWYDGDLEQNPEFGSSGFTALPGGYRRSSGSFDYAGNGGRWWSATEDVTNNAWYRGMNYDGSLVNRNDRNKEVGFSVRCVRD